MDDLLSTFHKLRLTGRMPHDGIFLDDLVSSGLLEVGDKIIAKLVGATFQGTLAAGSTLKGVVLRFEDPQKMLKIEEKTPGGFLRALGIENGLPESRYASYSTLCFQRASKSVTFFFFPAGKAVRGTASLFGRNL